VIAFAVGLLSLVVCTLLSGWIAGRRGRSTKLWYWLGAIFGPIAIVAVALLPSAPERTGRPPSGGPPRPALGSGPWRWKHGRASGRHGRPHRLDMVL